MPIFTFLLCDVLMLAHTSWHLWQKLYADIMCEDRNKSKYSCKKLSWDVWHTIIPVSFSHSLTLSLSLSPSPELHTSQWAYSSCKERRPYTSPHWASRSSSLHTPVSNTGKM